MSAVFAYGSGRQNFAAADPSPKTQDDITVLLAQSKMGRAGSERRSCSLTETVKFRRPQDVFGKEVLIKLLKLPQLYFFSFEAI